MKCCVFSAAKHLSLILHINRWHVTGPRTPLRTLHTCMSTAGFLLQTWACISCYLYSYQICSHKQDCQVIVSLWPIMVQCLVYFCIGPCFHEHYNLWLSTSRLHGPDRQREPNISQKICCDMSLIFRLCQWKNVIRLFSSNYIHDTYHFFISNLYIRLSLFHKHDSLYTWKRAEWQLTTTSSLRGKAIYTVSSVCKAVYKNIQLGRKEGSN